jgi:hypothetical protein
MNLTLAQVDEGDGEEQASAQGGSLTCIVVGPVSIRANIETSVPDP